MNQPEKNKAGQFDFKKLFELDRIKVVQTPEGWARMINPEGSTGAIVLPVFPNGDFLMVKEERWRDTGPFWAWNIPRGGSAQGETHEETAAHELFEETGIRLPMANFVFMAELQPDNGIFLSSCPIFKALIPEGLSWAERHENEETVETKRFGQSEVKGLIQSGDLTDAWTLSALGLLAAGF